MSDTPASNPLHPKFCADFAVHETVQVLANHQVAKDTYKLSFVSDQMATRFSPGQFLMLRLAGTDDPLIGRPLALYDIVPHEERQTIEVVYVVLGNLTTRLAQVAAGCPLEVWGPLGNGFVPRSTNHLIMIAGGIGHTPFLAVAKQHLGQVGYAGKRPHRFVDRVTFCYGVRSAAYLAGVEDFRTIGVDVRIATDDGSAGHHGLVTDLLADLIGHDARVVCCGPEPMMEAVSHVAARKEVPCEVSLETPMACGIGICFSCVARVRDEQGQWDYKRTCVEGPVFDGTRIEW